jgi:hypothetical protein
MAQDLNNSYNALQNGLYIQALSISAVLAAAAYLQFLSVFFVLIVINRYLGSDKKQEPYQNEVVKN